MLPAQVFGSYAVDQWYGVITAAKVDRSIVRKLSTAIVEAVHAPDIIKSFAASGETPVRSNPEQFGAYIKSEIAKWRKLVKDAELELH